ncbi:MAG: GerMN domain-containing protein [Candidatus Krumholzibacteria bacterium]|nr:GerMN domain-containing protein [Candidatus Krumholzibacteria bacterium]
MIGTKIGKSIAIALTVLAVVVAAAYLVQRFRAKGPAEVQPVSEEMRAVTIFFGNHEADGFASETREVPVAQGFEAQVKLVLAELIKGSHDSDNISAIPQGTELIQVFWVEDTQTLLLDFNKAFTANHPGGSTGEYYTISNIIKTVSANFPQVARVQFLVEGNTIESIAGHYEADRPIEVKKWR